MAKPTRVGFIGAGGIARAHADAFATLSDAEVVAVTDALPEAAAALAEKIGAKVFQSAEEMAASGEVDALYILIPPFAHGPAEHAALKHRLPFFMEKPVGIDTGLIEEIEREVVGQGLLTSVGYMTRYRRSVQRVRELLAEEPPILAYGGWWGGTPGGHSWWIDKSKSGGQFHEQATHTVDLARYFFGEASEVYAAAAKGFNKGLPGYSMDDSVTVAIKFKAGGAANLMASVSSNAGGSLFLRLHSLNRNVHFSEWEHHVRIETKGGEPEEIRGEPNIFAVEDAVFIEAVRSGDRTKVRSDYADGAKSARLSLAANRSLETGKVVEV